MKKLFTVLLTVLMVTTLGVVNVSAKEEKSTVAYGLVEITSSKDAKDFTNVTFSSAKNAYDAIKNVSEWANAKGSDDVLVIYKSKGKNSYDVIKKGHKDYSTSDFNVNNGNYNNKKVYYVVSCTAPTLNTDIVFNGKEQKLIKSSNDATGCEVRYGLSTSPEVEPTTWETHSANIVATDAGDYYVWYKGVKPGSSEVVVDPTYVKTTIAQEEITTATLNNGNEYVYDGEAYDVVSDLALEVLVDLGGESKDNLVTTDKAVKDVDYTLSVKKADTDGNYTIEATSNIKDAGKYQVQVSGLKNLKGTATFDFEIVQQTLQNDALDVSRSDTSYLGYAVSLQTFKLLAWTNGGYSENDKRNDLLEVGTVGTDYTYKFEKYDKATEAYVEVSDAEVKSVGKYKLTITGCGNYTGTVSGEFEITQQGLLQVNFNIAGPQYNEATGYQEVTYKGKQYFLTEILPEMLAQTDDSGSNKNLLLEPNGVEGTDYVYHFYKDGEEVERTRIVNAGTYTIEVAGKGNFSGSASGVFRIIKEDVTLTGDTQSYIYDSEPKAFTNFTITGNNSSEDYTSKAKITYDGSSEAPTNAGTYTVVVTLEEGENNNAVTNTYTMVVSPCGINNATIAEIDGQIYTTKSIEPELTLTFKDDTLVKGIDYTVIYSENVNIGKATVTIAGIGNFMGKTSTTFEIFQRHIEEATLEEIGPQTYTTKSIEPELTLTYNGKTLVKGVDYEVIYSNNVNVGTAKVTISGIGNFKASREKSFEIYSLHINNAVLTEIPGQIYTGSSIEPAVTITYEGITLVKGIDYELIYKDNINVGTATIEITGKGNYKGLFEGNAKFGIYPLHIENATIAEIEGSIYSGEALEPDVNVTFKGETLVKGKDYELTYADNVNIGFATVTISGIGNFKASITKSFEIYPLHIENVKVAAIADQVYADGEALEPELTVTYGDKELLKGYDYEVEYSNNIVTGTGRVTIKGINNFKAEITKSFKIVKAPNAIKPDDYVQTLDKTYKTTKSYAKNLDGNGYFIASAPANDLEAISVDGKEIDIEKCGKVIDGSTIVVLNQAYMSKLKDGVHTIELEFSNYETVTHQFTVYTYVESTATVTKTVVNTSVR